MEDENTLMITPATFRRWTRGPVPVEVHNLPTQFGDLDLTITADGGTADYSISLKPQGGQERRRPDRILLYPRVCDGERIASVEIDGQPFAAYATDVIFLPEPGRRSSYNVRVARTNGGEKTVPH